jgi:aconitate hydratase
MLEPICGPCIGVGQAPAARRPVAAHLQPQLPWRSGTQGDQVYLCSPATAAASALTGRLTDPRDLEGELSLRPPPERLRIDDRHILAPQPGRSSCRGAGTSSILRAAVRPKRT